MLYEWYAPAQLQTDTGPPVIMLLFTTARKGNQIQNDNVFLLSHESPWIVFTYMYAYKWS